jgi:hypothetical protein
MPREHNRLTVRKISKPLARGLHSDGDGLYLQVSKWGTKSWVLRYRLKGRARTMGLGSCRDISLKQARERAGRARELLTDPIVKRPAMLTLDRRPILTPLDRELFSH